MQRLELNSMQTGARKPMATAAHVLQAVCRVCSCLAPTHVLCLLRAGMMTTEGEFADGVMAWHCTCMGSGSSCAGAHGKQACILVRHAPSFGGATGCMLWRP